MYINTNIHIRKNIYLKCQNLPRNHMYIFLIKKIIKSYELYDEFTCMLITCKNSQSVTQNQVLLTIFIKQKLKMLILVFIPLQLLKFKSKYFAEHTV